MSSSIKFNQAYELTIPNYDYQFTFQNSQNHQIITVDNSNIEHCDISFDRKLKLEYHLTPPHNKIDGKLSQDQESEQHSQNEYFQEVRK